MSTYGSKTYSDSTVMVAPGAIRVSRRANSSMQMQPFNRQWSITDWQHSAQWCDDVDEVIASNGLTEFVWADVLPGATTNNTSAAADKRALKRTVFGIIFIEAPKGM